MAKRDVDILILSDIHLGTFGCRAKELLRYLKSINPKKVILNGDIIDIWQFSKSYWPESHMKVVRRILKYVAEGIPVHYLTGNHDEMLRRFTDMNLGSLQLANKLLLDIDGKKAWIFHGDIFDVTMQHSKWLAKLGAIGYDTLIILNSFVNWCLGRLGYEKMSFSKKVKERFKDAVKFINDFERTASELAVDNGYEYVICGHIHQPEMREMVFENGTVQYLNSGDWVESLTALEYTKGQWELYRYDAAAFAPEDPAELLSETVVDQLDVRYLLESMKGTLAVK